MSNSKIDPVKYPNMVVIEDAFNQNFRFAAKSIDRCLDLFGERWLRDFEETVKSVFSSQDALMAAVRGYSRFAIQSMRLQAEFERELKYRSKTYEEASAEVYFNETHMMNEYLPGLLLSHFLWPHHYRQLEFFHNTFVKSMSVAGASSFIEVGVGTGLYSSTVLRTLPEVTGVGYDISPSSAAFADAQMRALGVADRYQTELRDIISTPLEAKARWLVCVEVLEHLENPLEFLVGLRENLEPGARAFITAAVNAAHADHIFLYRSSGDVLSQIERAGFTVEEGFIGRAYKPTEYGVPVPEAAAFVVC